MTARGDARKRQAEGSGTHVVRWPLMDGRCSRPGCDQTCTIPDVVADEHADILAELAETQAALHAATNDVVRLAAELHTAHGQVDRVRALADKWADHASRCAAETPPHRPRMLWSIAAEHALAALDGGAS